MNFYIWKIIIGASIITILCKTLPILILSKINLNKKLLKFLNIIPIAILCVLVISEIFTLNNNFCFKLPETTALIVSIITALKKDNLLLTVLSGVVTLALLRFIF